MTTTGRFSDTLRDHASRAERFLRDYTAGMSSSDLRRLFRRDAAEAFTVLTRDRDERSGEGFQDFVESVRAFLVGISFKLSPARRLLFALSLLCAVLGLVSFEFTLDTEAYDLFLDFSPLWFLGSIAGLGLLLTLELVDRLRVKDELELARELQRALLPEESPELPGWGLAHSYRTANTVGGDYYGFPRLPDGRVAVTIGDASGHGMAAGLVMAIADATMATALELDPEPGAVAALLNRALARIGGRRAFMSLFYGLLDPATGRLDWVCAGHPFPLLRRLDGRVEELGEGGLPLGMRADLSPPTGSTTVGSGELLVLYTDGIAEAVDAEGRAFGYLRLAEAVAAGGGARTVHDTVLSSFEHHQGIGQGRGRGEPRLTDDVTLVTLERLDPHRPPVPPPPPPPAA